MTRRIDGKMKSYRERQVREIELLIKWKTKPFQEMHQQMKIEVREEKKILDDLMLGILDNQNIDDNI